MSGQPDDLETASGIQTPREISESGDMAKNQRLIALAKDIKSRLEQRKTSLNYDANRPGVNTILTEKEADKNGRWIVDTWKGEEQEFSKETFTAIFEPSEETDLRPSEIKERITSTKIDVSSLKDRVGSVTINNRAFALNVKVAPSPESEPPNIEAYSYFLSVDVNQSGEEIKTNPSSSPKVKHLTLDQALEIMEQLSGLV